MMSSTFQTLPSHVIHKVLDYVLANKPFSGKHAPYNLSILHSCHRWREVLKESKYTELHINYNTNSGLEANIAGPGVIPCFGLNPLPIADRVKQIYFRINNFFDVSNGRMLDLFLQSDCVGHVLPSARKLEIQIESMCNSDNSNAPILDTQEDADNAQKQMLKFIRGLRTMLPNVKNIRLDWDCDESVEPSDFLTTIVSKMISGIIDGVKNVAYLDSENLIENISFDPDVFSGLTSFHYYFNGADKRGLDIILRNCDTLQNLTVEEMPAKFIDPMLYRENGDSIVFGCLKSLYLSYPTGTISSDTQDYKCHFPALQKLNIHGSDPIISNAVFNGTEQLEYLGLWNTYDTVDNINDQQMFKHCQLRNLKHLMLSYNCKASQVSLNNEPNKINQYSKFIGNLIKQPDCLQSLSLTSSRFETKLLYVLSTTTAFANIQRMEFTMIAMRFEDIVSVIRNCPQLNFLHCSPVNSYPSIDGIKDAELVMLLETSMYPLSKYLASVYVDFQRFWLSRETHLALALLAVGCPRLSNVNCFSAHLNTMQEGMRELADDSVFSDYRHRLQTIVAKY